MGEVYRAVARRDGRVVALKRLMTSTSGNAEAVAMLQSEADLARFLDHPGISKVADVGQVEGVHYIAYNYVHGRNLRAIQARASRDAGRDGGREGGRRGAPPSSGRRSSHDGEPRPQVPIDLDVAVHVVLRVAEALGHAHARRDGEGRPLRLVHRDVSPTNVLVSFDGAVKLLDFGIARAVGVLVRTDAGQVKGTVGYMSPEQVRGEALDARSDIYSLGICFWELCTGRRLVDSAEVAARIVAGDVPSPRASGAKSRPSSSACSSRHSRNSRSSGTLEPTNSTLISPGKPASRACSLTLFASHVMCEACSPKPRQRKPHLVRSL